MNEDERKQNIEFIIKDLKALNYNENFIGIIKETLDLYQKEKEKNKLLIAGKFKEVADKNEYIKDMYISKDKIREKINKEIDSLINNSTNFNIGDIELLREKLLEEDNENIN